MFTLPSFAPPPKPNTTKRVTREELTLAAYVLRMVYAL